MKMKTMLVKLKSNEVDWTNDTTLYEEGASIARGGEEQLDKKLDVQLDMELAMKLEMKTSHGSEGGEEACARKKMRSAAPPGRPPRRRARSKVRSNRAPDQPSPTPTRFPTGANRAPSSKPGALAWSPPGARPGFDRISPVPGPIDRLEYEALRYEMRREFRTQDDELRGTVQEISQKVDATNETVTTMQDQMTDIQRSLQVLQLAIDNLTQQQQLEDEDPELQDEARGVGRGVGRGNRGHGFVELGARRVPPQQQDDGLGKPKFSVPKFEGGADIE
ncbi:hypothetical protein QYE76_011721 [Lolium multiflorum]|uniref:Uncharacterized protein n=1 Tax=Lolium multiflorum TaxID=4521 RepID=A0AAD8U016_LOLMU|nr:hypothetical protein QYE76_011721 [Lolium multiflorum]